MPRPRRLPAVDEAMILFSAVLLLLFYVSPTFARHGLLPAVVGNELLLILAPCLLFAWVARWDWVPTFNWRKSSAPILLAAALIGIGLCPWVQFENYFQEKLWPTDPQVAKENAELFVNALKAFPVVSVLVVGLLAGICEEILFRGPVQVSLLRRTPPAWAIFFAAVLFSAAHLDLHGFPIRTVLGCVLGWMAWNRRSIFPAMLAHCCFDSTGLAMYAWQIKRESVTGAQQTGITSLDIAVLAAGAALVGIGALIWYRATRSADSRPGFPIQPIRSVPLLKESDAKI